MPSPIVIRDPSTYHHKHSDPTSIFGEGVVSPALRGLIPFSSNTEDKAFASVTPNPQTAVTPRDDISTSPRLLGYVFSCISSAVSMISSTVFFRTGIQVASAEAVKSYALSFGVHLTPEELRSISTSMDRLSGRYNVYLGIGGIVVQRWKIYGAIAISSLITSITLSVVIAHFDSYCCPNICRHFFRDGSLPERNLIMFLLVLSAFSLHISTSKFSVGEAQANVFFSTWTNFISCVMNYEIWRKYAGKDPSFGHILFDPGHRSKRHWFLLSIFATISFLASLEFFIHNNFLTDDWLCLKLSWANNWVWIALGSSIFGWGILLSHQYLSEQILSVVEVAVLSAIIFLYGLTVASYTGGRLDEVSCPSNLYFGMWFTFFTAIWTFSSLIKRIGRFSKRVSDDDENGVGC